MGPTSISNAAEEEDHAMVASVFVVEVRDNEIGSGHGGISVILTSSMYA
jgi:hypothetical protein